MAQMFDLTGNTPSAMNQKYWQSQGTQAQAAQQQLAYAVALRQQSQKVAQGALAALQGQSGQQGGMPPSAQPMPSDMQLPPQTPQQGPQGVGPNISAIPVPPQQPPLPPPQLGGSVPNASGGPSMSPMEPQVTSMALRQGMGPVPQQQIQQPQQQAQPPAMQQPQQPSPQQMAQQQLGGGYSLQQMAQAVQQSMGPNADSRDVLAAVDRASSLLNASAKQQLDMMKMQMQSGVMGNPNAIQEMADYIKTTGNTGILARYPASVRSQVMALLGQQGTSGADIGRAGLDYKGRGREVTSLSGQLGTTEFAASGFKEIMPDAIAASDAVPRGSWKFANQAKNWLMEQSSDPKFAEFQAFNLGLVREYARGMGGTVSAQNHATEVLGTAKSPEAYRAAVNALNKELGHAETGGRKARKGAITGSDGINVGEDDMAAPPSGQDFSNLWK